VRRQNPTPESPPRMLNWGMKCGFRPTRAQPEGIGAVEDGRLVPVTLRDSVVVPGGVVNIVGSGTYDTFTIAKAVTVQAEPGVVATISVPTSGKDITVNAASTSMLHRLTSWR
jgi:hypothetical protein